MIELSNSNAIEKARELSDIAVQLVVDARNATSESERKAYRKAVKLLDEAIKNLIFIEA